jgi:Protein of unknown function (DUF3999)
MMSRNSLSILLLFISACCLGQASKFNYRRKLSPITKEGWHSISLPSEIFKQINSAYTDVRLYQIDETDTLEVPYLMKVQTDEVNEATISLPVLNKSTKDGKLFLTFRLNQNQSVNYLDLRFEEDNFNGYVKIEGSNDQKEWFELVSRQRILSIQTSDINFSSLTLNFPPTNYTYLRTAISSDKPLTFTSASFRARQVKQGVFNDVKLSQAITQQKKEKQTVAELSLSDYQPVQKLSIQINHQGDYYRPFSLEALRDSSQAPNQSWIYYYTHVYSGYLTSIEPNEFEFPIALAKKLKLSISNADNPPLTIEKVTASGPKVHITAQLKAGTNTFLYYGNRLGSAPFYDLMHFRNNIPDSVSVIQLEAEEKLIIDKKKRSPLLENKLWLWIAMAAIIGLLGFATLKMMSKK